jgi:hypothetical protein
MNHEAEIQRLLGYLKEIANNHQSDGHFCRICGAEGGQWPCETYLTAHIIDEEKGQEP